MTDSFTREGIRIVKIFVGPFIYAVGVVMTLQANLGYSPWYVFHQGLGRHLGITIGQASIIVSAIMVLITVLMKENVGIGTLGGVILIGGFVDIILFGNWIPLMRNFVPGFLIMIGGLFVIGLGSFFYIGAGYGAGPRDSLMVVLTKHTGKPVGLCRGCIEGTALFIGWLMGGYAGVGTVIYVFGIGAAVQIVFSILRFDVKKINQEPFYETYLRLRDTLR